MLLNKSMIKINYEFANHFIKYNFVGFANAVFTFVIYVLFLKVLKFDYLVSFSISWISGVVFTYIINFVWVFTPESKLIFSSRFGKYFAVYLLSYSFNIFLLRLIHTNFKFDPLVIQIFILPFVVVINFSGIKYWALKKS